MKHTLSPKDLAEAVGVSESSLKRWADEGLVQVVRTTGGHRRITIAEAIRYIRQAGLPIVNPKALGISDLARMPTEHLTRPNAADQPLVDAVMNSQAEVARGLVLSMYITGRSISEICDGPLTRAMHAVGDLWKHSQAGILIEHRATDICAQTLHLLRGILPPAADKAPVALGGTPSGDPYMLTSLMAATVLAGEGWREENLGPDVPIDLFAQAARERHASLVWLSVCTEVAHEKIASQISSLGLTLQQHGATLAVGGRALPPRPMLLTENVNVIGTMSELAAFSRGLRSSIAKAVPSQTSAPSAIAS